MLSWIAENAGTILVSALLLAAVCASAAKMRRDRKKGGCSCGCDCGSCAHCKK